MSTRPLTVTCFVTIICHGILAREDPHRLVILLPATLGESAHVGNPAVQDDIAARRDHLGHRLGDEPLLAS